MIAPRTAQVKPSLDIAQTTPEVCESCNGEAFIESVLLRKVSALLTDTGREGYLPIQVFACVKCGHVNAHFIPSEIRTLPAPSASPIIT